MTRTLRILLLFVFTVFSGSAFAQEISGKVLDEKKEPLINAAVQVFKGGILMGGTVTDYDGMYTVKPLDPGYYDVLVQYTGYDSALRTGVVVSTGRTPVNFNMARHDATNLKAITIVQYRKPLIDQEDPSKRVMTSAEIAVLPTTQIADLVALAPGLYQKQRGGNVNMGGARADGTLYIIDGVQVQGTIGVDMSQGSVDQLEVMTSGISAKYGDVSGGVVNITSRGVSQKMTGQLRVQHSIDGYQNNLASFSIAGPIYKKTIKDGEYTRKKPVLGFSLSGDYYNDKNRYPSFYNQYVAKDEVLNKIQANPLKIITDNTGTPIYNYASNYITKEDLVQVKIPKNNALEEVRMSGKLDYQLTDNMHIVAGGSLNYVRQDQYNRALVMFSPQAIPVRNTFSGRGFIRFQQKFGKASGDTSSKQSIISNAYYDVQADYQLLYRDQEDPTFKKDVFKYGYIGKFTPSRTNIYAANSTDSFSGRPGTVLQNTFINTFAGDGVSFERSEMNPLLANYTSQFYSSLNGFKPQTINQLQARNALANGDQPRLTYDQVYSPGQTITSYSFVNNKQYALTVNAAFDLLVGKTKHAIEFGLYYQQRVERNYFATGNLNGVGTNTLWSQMRQLVSSIDNGNLKLDKSNPIFKVNGKSYSLAEVNNGVVIPGATDTIIYNYINIGGGTGGTNFDKNLRKKLGISSTENIDLDALDPSTFSLNMFSADELLASGKSFVGYQGYTYTGEQQGNVNFNDFWTKKDKNGNYTRPIGAFTPNYIAGYLLDKFNYKDMHFNVGVRIDRYSANTKVLIDPYSFYAEKSVSQVAGSGNTANGGVHPSNIGGNYIVYVDDNNTTTPNIIGYRNGNNWYDPTGKYIEDPAILKQYSGGRPPEPFLVKNANGQVPDIIDTNFNPNQSFTDYTPQVTIQPRLSFNFPISDVADFYAHYDIYAQRPTAFNNANASDYYFLQQNSTNIINNANLKPQKIFDYEVGFQQKLSDHSSLTLSAFYKERKDMISIVPYLNAYPTTYFTYGNRDFSTTKGTTLLYDMRATNHLRLNITYTLQFAEGTGSSANSTNGNGQSNGQISFTGLLQSFIQAGLPNMRYVNALDYDSRHLLNATIDYRFNDGEGPVVGGKYILQRAGLSIVPKARSGEPYTRFRDARGNTVVGGVNGSRLPWHYGVDLRADKDFSLNFGKKDKDALPGVKPKRPLFLKAILQVNNLLNTREILNVYNYTGKPDDDGYLTSSFGKQFVPQQVNPRSYSDIYAIMNNNPANFNYARSMSIALQFNF